MPIHPLPRAIENITTHLSKGFLNGTCAGQFHIFLNLVICECGFSNTHCLQ